MDLATLQLVTGLNSAEHWRHALCRKRRQTCRRAPSAPQQSTVDDAVTGRETAGYSYSAERQVRTGRSGPHGRLDLLMTYILLAFRQVIQHHPILQMKLIFFSSPTESVCLCERERKTDRQIKRERGERERERETETELVVYRKV